MAVKHRIVITRELNLCRRWFDLTVVANNSGNEMIFRRPIRKSSEEPLKNVGSLGEELVRGLMNIPGIITVTLENAYRLKIEIGNAFEWEEIQKGVIHHLYQLYSRHSVPREGIKIEGLTEDAKQAPEALRVVRPIRTHQDDIEEIEFELELE